MRNAEHRSAHSRPARRSALVLRRVEALVPAPRVVCQWSETSCGRSCTVTGELRENGYEKHLPVAYSTFGRCLMARHFKRDRTTPKMLRFPLNPADFTSPQDNIYLPMRHGRTYVYMAQEVGWADRQ